MHTDSSSTLVGKQLNHNQLIFLVDIDQQTMRDLAEQIGYFGYTVRTFTEPTELELAMQQTLPAEIILESSYCRENNGGTSNVVQRIREHSIPLIFTSVCGNLRARLQAVRAGGSAYFTKPVSVGSLVDTLDTFTVQRMPEPFHILIIDDEPTLAAYYATTLQHAGMTTAVITDPMQALQHLEEASPDLILMDMYMPGCTGLELAAVIRQQVAYISVPIVFLSAETNPDRQWAAMYLGGDDFLTKPIQPDHLVAAVTSRVQRARTLRTFMIRDSLTGLLNHTNTREQLDIETVRARRSKHALTVVMIDIDHFK